MGIEWSPRPRTCRNRAPCSRPRSSFVPGATRARRARGTSTSCRGSRRAKRAGGRPRSCTCSSRIHAAASPFVRPTLGFLPSIDHGFLSEPPTSIASRVASRSSALLPRQAGCGRELRPGDHDCSTPSPTRGPGHLPPHRHLCDRGGRRHTWRSTWRGRASRRGRLDHPDDPSREHEPEHHRRRRTDRRLVSRLSRARPTDQRAIRGARTSDSVLVLTRSVKVSTRDHRNPPPARSKVAVWSACLLEPSLPLEPAAPAHPRVGHRRRPGDGRARTAPRRVTYADYTASGRALSFLEDFIRARGAAPLREHAHRVVAAPACRRRGYREDARAIIREAVNGDDDTLSSSSAARARPAPSTS